MTYKEKVAELFEAGRSPRVEDLVSYSDAAHEFDIPVHRLQYAAAKRQLVAVPLPNRSTALVRSELEAWLASRGHGHE